MSNVNVLIQGLFYLVALSFLMCLYPWVDWYVRYGKFIWDCLMSSEDVDFDSQAKQNIVMWFSITTSLFYLILLVG